MTEPNYDIGQVRETIRHCDHCGRDLELSPLGPGWQPVKVGEAWQWWCPDCCRTEGRA